MNRRMFLKTGSAAIVITGLTTSGIWLGTRTPSKALAPWHQSTQGYGDARLDALAYAILAPNPHNRQPWQVNLVNDDTIDIYCDLNKMLPETDPFNRQIVIGMGCFIELYRMAAANLGYQAIIESFPDGEPLPVLDNKRIARITIKPDKVVKDPLFDYVFARRSTKEAFDIERPIADHLLAQLTHTESVSGTVQSKQVKSLNNTIYQGMKIEFETARTLKESANLMRFGKAEVEANPDGIDLTGVPMELMIKTGILTRADFADPNSALTKDYLTRVKGKFNTSMGYTWITTANNSRHQQLNAGRDYVRLNLQATQLGLAIQPVSQTLQEYPEMAHLYQKLHAELDVETPAKLQMLARLGYCSAIAPSPRWPLASILINA